MISNNYDIRLEFILLIHKKTSKINDFRGLLNFGGPYGTVYEPFFTGFEETLLKK